MIIFISEILSIVLLIWIIFSFQYKKFGGKKTIDARVLEIANHVDKVLFVSFKWFNSIIFYNLLILKKHYEQISPEAKQPGP